MSLSMVVRMNEWILVGIGLMVLAVLALVTPTKPITVPDEDESDVWDEWQDVGGSE